MRIIFDRFISDELHKVQVPIRVIDDRGLSGVEFFKTPKFEKKYSAVSIVFSIIASQEKAERKRFICNFLGTLCHCLFDCCIIFERVF